MNQILAKSRQWQQLHLSWLASIRKNKKPVSRNCRQKRLDGLCRKTSFRMTSWDDSARYVSKEMVG